MKCVRVCVFRKSERSCDSGSPLGSGVFFCKVRALVGKFGSKVFVYFLFSLLDQNPLTSDAVINVALEWVLVWRRESFTAKYSVLMIWQKETVTPESSKQSDTAVPTRAWIQNVI